LRISYSVNKDNNTQYAIRNIKQENGMPKRPSAYFRPQSLDEALSLLSRPQAMALAGGTALLASDVNGEVVDLQELGLDQVEFLNGRLLAGTMVRLAALAEYLEENGRREDPTTLLSKAIRQAGPNTFRNAATLGGVIASRPADSELLAALLVLEAELTLQTAGRPAATLSLSDYLAADERPAGLITEIAIPWQNGQAISERVARTPADYPIVSITAWQPDGGTVRLAATGIRQRPLRLATAEDALANGLVEDATLAKAAAAASQASNHPGDFRGDTAYRAQMAAVLTRRVLTQIQ
jgi:probable selenate reductase FAD-binding subunit